MRYRMRRKPMTKRGRNMALGKQVLVILILLCSICLADSLDYNIGLWSGRSAISNTELRLLQYDEIAESIFEYPYSVDAYYLSGGIGYHSLFIRATACFKYKSEKYLGYDTYNVGNILSIKSKFATEAKTRDMTFDLGYRFNEVALFISFNEHIHTSKMFNGMWVAVNTGWGIKLIPEYMTNLNSFHRVNFHAFGIGGEYKHNLVMNKLNLLVRARHFFKSDAESAGYWNIQKLRFDHVLELEKTMVDIILSYHLTSYMELYCGYFTYGMSGHGKGESAVQGGEHWDNEDFKTKYKNKSYGLIVGFNLMGLIQ